VRAVGSTISLQLIRVHPTIVMIVQPGDVVILVAHLQVRKG